MTLDALYITYWSARDPLTLSQSLPIVRALAAEGWPMGIMTFEQPPWALGYLEAQLLRRELAEAGVSWFPRTYHRRPAVLSTAYDALAGAFEAARIGRAHGVRLFHGRATVPTAMAAGAARTNRALFFDDADGPLSQEYVDAGRWRKGSLPYRLTAWAERRAFRTADRVAVLSTLRRDEVTSLARAPIDVLPCGVDTSLFRRDEAARARLRAEMGLRGRVLVYAGKAGGWYRTDLMLDFVAAVRAAVRDELSLLVLTTAGAEPFTIGSAKRGLHCVVRRAERHEVPGYFSAADAGLSFRLTSPSQRACSPIKNGEYLACGLPVVSTAGAGDYPELFRRERVGVVVDDETPSGLAGAARELCALLAEGDLAARCRAVAERSVGLHEVVIPRYRAIYEGMLGSPGQRASGADAGSR